MRLSPRFFFCVILVLVGQNTTSSFETSIETKEVVVLQRRLSTTALHDERVVIQANLDRVVQSAAHQMKQVFRETQRPAEREDSDQEIGKGTMLWHLGEASQWWGTALAIQHSDSLTVLHHASGERRTAHRRGVDVRAVRIEDQAAWWSEFLRDQGELARQRGDQEERKKKYLEALEVDPTNPHALDNLGIFYTDKGDFETSKLYYEKAIQANEKWWHPYYNLGLLYRDHQNNPREALRVFDTAFQLNPLMLDSLWNVAEMHSRMGNFGEECYHWRLLRVLNRNPSPYEHKEREFEVWPTVWHDGWENFTTDRIERCMAAVREKQEVENSSNEEL